MYYYEPDDHRNKRTGIIAAVAYVAVWGVLMLFASWKVEIPQSDEGILINFGNTQQAGGKTDLALNDRSDRLAAPQPTRKLDEEEVLTSKAEDAPAVVETKKPQKTEPKPEQEKPKPREVNRKALFPGRTVGSQSASEGTSEGKGNEGQESGAPDGAHAEGGGVGTSGHSFDLSGRYLVGSLPVPEYNANEQGRVVVQITVNREGRVTSASYRQQGSTTNRSELVNAALKAARQARFTVSEASDGQTGTITYIFKLH